MHPYSLVSDNFFPALRKLCDFLRCFQGLFRFFFQISRIFLIILRYSFGNLSENVYVKILSLTLTEKFSRTCDFCLIIADRPEINLIKTNNLHSLEYFILFKYARKVLNCVY